MIKQISKGFTERAGFALLAVVILGMVVVFDVVSPLGGNIRFYSEWMRCGERPLLEGALPGGGVRFYKTAPVVGIFRGYQTKYYCTPAEAEKAGLSANSHQYQFPHIP